MLKNNLSALLLYVGMNILFYIVFVWKDSLFQYHTTPMNLVIDVLLSLVALVLFFWIGRSKLFHDQGSKRRNLLSVSLVFVIGVVIAIASNPYQGPTFSIFYWGYFLPFSSVLESLKVEPVSGTSLQMAYLVLTSLLPVLLIWAGIQSKAKKS